MPPPLGPDTAPQETLEKARRQVPFTVGIYAAHEGTSLGSLRGAPALSVGVREGGAEWAAGPPLYSWTVARSSATRRCGQKPQQALLLSDQPRRPRWLSSAATAYL